MKLHTDTDGFTALLHIVSESRHVYVGDIRHPEAGALDTVQSALPYSQASGIDVLEKDYYMTLLLKALAGWQDVLPAYCKGGSALAPFRRHCPPSEPV